MESQAKKETDRNLNTPAKPNVTSRSPGSPVSPRSKRGKQTQLYLFELFLASFRKLTLAPLQADMLQVFLHWSQGCSLSDHMLSDEAQSNKAPAILCFSFFFYVVEKTLNTLCHVRTLQLNVFRVNQVTEGNPSVIWTNTLCWEVSSSRWSPLCAASLMRGGHREPKQDSCFSGWSQEGSWQLHRSCFHKTTTWTHFNLWLMQLQTLWNMFWGFWSVSFFNLFLLIAN